MDVIRKGWFTEFSPEVHKSASEAASSDEEGSFIAGTFPGQAFSLQVESVLFHEKSKYQDVLLFASKSYGNVLVLDGLIQCTERDEFAYQEMLAHLAMCSHMQPRNVLVIGGGDGGVVREVLKHSCVETVTLCEIDELVVQVAKQFLPKMSKALSNPKVKIHIGDGFEFIKEHKNEFDVIITDSSDPVGPAESLFKKAYYSSINDSLKTGGVMCSQGECPWLDVEVIQRMWRTVSSIFPSQAYAVGSVPTYTSGLMGYLLCSKEKRVDLKTPLRKLSSEELENMGLRYYTSDLHSASFILPRFVEKILEKK